MNRRALAPASVLFVASVVPALAQSGIDDSGQVTGYLNFESSQVKPLAVAVVGDERLLLACNTADSSVEVFRTSDLAFVRRIPVAQEPVSVVWSETSGAFYTCNLIGDSVTKVALGSGPQGLSHVVERTEYVGDEPMHLALLESLSPPTLAVSLQSTSSVAFLRASDLSVREDLEDTELVNAAETHVLKDPRTVVAATGGLFVLGARGASVDPSTPGGFDLFFSSTPGDGTATDELDHLGTTIFNMAFAGGHLYVVSGSRPDGLQGGGEPVVAAAESGFVESWVHRVDAATLAAPDSRDLNLDGAGDPVGPGGAVCQPMDVAAWVGPSGNVEKLFVASFGTDRIAVVSDLDLPPASWTVSTFDVPPLAPPPNAIAGPRGLALDVGAPGGDALFVLNRLDASIAKFDAVTHQLLGTQALTHDPTPEYVRVGRRFLYDAKLSGTGFVSCASCHVDGKLDGLKWNLGINGRDQDGQSDLFAELVDGITGEDAQEDYLADGFYLQKGVMMTQSLQGLVNWEADPATQDLFTNAPYHWRGDRRDFVAFDVAFDGLLGGSVPPPADMEAFERFVSSIAYPPNPEQELGRVYQGALGPPFTAEPGSGPMLGLRAYHTTQISGTCAGRSCVQCHSLPEGSNNKSTQVFGDVGLGGAIDPMPPVETAAWRGLRQKEKLYVRFDEDGHEVTDLIAQVDGGLAHFNAFETIDDFVDAFPELGSALDEMAQFLRRLDTGTAPAVGRSVSVSLGGMHPEEEELVDLFLEQAGVGNVGVVVHLHRFDGAFEGFWYDLGDANPTDPFRREPDGARFSMDDLLAELGILPSDAIQLTIECVPLGSERRLAHPSGDPPVLAGSAPSGIQLLPMAPNTAYALVPLLRDNWDPDPEPGGQGPGLPAPFVWQANQNPGFPDSEPESLRRTRVMQNALVAGGFLPWTRHDAPRRFLVRGKNVRHGAVLEIEVGSAGDPVLRLPIFATAEPGVWTTAVEAEPFVYYQLMLGGPSHPGVQRLLSGQIPGEEAPPGTFDPPLDNRHVVRIVNADGSSGSASDQALELAD